MERRHQRIADLRLILFASFVTLVVLALGFKLLSLWFCAVPVIAFVPVAIVHDGVLRARERARRTAAYYRRGLDRLADAWAGAGPAGERFLDPEHPYAADLDLFGEGSLFQLLCQARTRSGEECLARWLSAPAGPEEIRGRQEAIAELRGALDLRERLAVLGEEWQRDAEPDRLRAWCSAPSLSPQRSLRIAVQGVTLLTVAAAIGAAAFGAPLTLLAVAIIVQMLIRFRLRRTLRRVNAWADRMSVDLSHLGTVLACFEGGSFRAAMLRRLSGRVTGEPSASRSLRRLRLLVDCHEARRNQLFAPLVFVTLWDVHFAFAIESWRTKHGPRIPAWLDAVGEFEALSSFAAYSYERPEDPFAEIVEEAAPRLEATGLGHPLLADRSCVRNDLRLGGGRDGALPALLVVSGSNMSGKSTFLRAAGVAAVMAQAGCPVRARSLALTKLQTAASIRVVDSLQAHVSHFYAEIQRLRRITDLLSGEGTVLFLIDEMLQGTNSHDRLVGSTAVLRGFVERGALGMITTHDLALTKLASSPGVPAANVHFADQLGASGLQFDYRLRPGVVSRSNALELMRMVGLTVPDSPTGA